MKNAYIAIFTVFGLFSCQDYTPKPRAMIRLEYPAPKYQLYEGSHFRFDKNYLAKIKKVKYGNINLVYPKMKASIYMTYKPVKGNLKNLISDAQKLTYKHVIKADNIIEQPYENRGKRIFGMYYSVTGNAASQTQIYVTDSIRHFITASLYFYAKPNYDSIYPAAIYLRRDMRKIMETIRWKD